MNPWIERLLGYTLTIAAAVGLVANLAALLFVPKWAGDANRTLVSNLTLFDQTLTTTAQALDVVEGTLKDVDGTLEAVKETALQVSDSLSDTIPLVESVGAVTGQELPDAIDSTQKSLATAQVGASGIDSVLSTLSFLGGTRYNPEISLASSLGQISQDLEPLKESLQEIESNVKVAGENLVDVQQDIAKLNRTLSQFDDNLADARAVNLQYQEVVETQQAVVRDLLQTLPGWITWGGRAFAAVLLWLVVVQFGMLTQGLELIARGRRRELEYDLVDELTNTETAAPSD